MTDALQWDPPSPGTWTQLADHYPRPVTRVSESLCEVWSEESTAYMQRLGLPIESATMATINGLPYLSMAAGGGGKKVPPPWVMNLMVKLVPSLRRSEKRLTQLFEQRPWNAAVAAWYDHERAEAIARSRVLADVEVFALGADALAEHLDAAYANLRHGMRQHIALHEHDTFPPGLFIVEAGRMGVAHEKAFALLQGSSPSSTGASPELDRLRRAVAGRTASTLEELAALDAEVEAALAEFLAVHGWRIIDGYDIDGSCLAEVPSLVVALACRSPRQERGGIDVEDVRGSIAPANRALFDRLLTEGRASYGLRDDNSAILMAWPVGLVRRAWLAAGRLLESAGQLADSALAIEATAAELGAALRGRGALDSACLARRAEHRSSLRAHQAPAVIGPPEGPMPTGMKGALGLVFEIFTVFDFGASADRTPLVGKGQGVGTYTGTARIVAGADPDALERFAPGDVLVAPMTSPSYNVLLSLAGALVTDEGGAFSHAAIMARELGIPAVVGAAEASRRIPEGALVTVDPEAGRVTIHPAGAAPVAGSTERVSPSLGAG